MDKPAKNSSQPGQIKSGVAAAYASLAVSAMIALFFTPLLLRGLGKAEYGIYSLALSIITYLRILNYGFSSPYMRIYSRFQAAGDETAVERFNGLFFVFSGVLGLLAVILGIGFALNVDLFFGAKMTMAELDTLRTLILLLLASLFTSFPCMVFNCYIVARERFFVARMMTIGMDVTVTLISAALLLTGHGSVALIAVHVAIQIALHLLRAWYCFARLKMAMTLRGLELTLLLEIIPFSVFTLLNYIAIQFNSEVDKLLLGALHGSTSIAVYTVGATFIVYLTALSVAVSNVFIPRVNRMVAQGESDMALTRLLTKVGRFQWLAISLIVSGFCFFGRPFIIFWAGPDYAGAYYIALLLLPPMSLSLIQDVGVEIQRAKNLHRFRSVLYFAISLANVAISIPLCRAYGALGCAIGTACATLLGNGIIMNIYYERRIGLNMRFFWRRILALSRCLIPPVLLGIFFAYTVDLYNMYAFLLCGAAYTAVYAASAWLWGMDESEKDIIRWSFHRFSHRFSRKESL